MQQIRRHILTVVAAGVVLISACGLAGASPRRTATLPAREFAPGTSGVGSRTAQGNGGGGDGCTVDVAPPALREYDPLHPPTGTERGFVRFTNCSRGNYTASVIASPGMSNSFAIRTLRDTEGDALPYNLFLDEQGTLVWGDGSASGAPRLDVTISNGSGVAPFYAGYVAAPKAAREGEYSDDIEITVTYT
jgi:type 1 fimbria pilin